MSHEFLLWICTTAYGLHVLEEFELNWCNWARSILGLPVDWNSFYVVNALVLVLGICCAGVGWRCPEFALAYPALMVINATLFHVLPVIVTRVFSPGVVTGVVLFYPIPAWTYYGAWTDGALTAWQGVVSGVLAALLMACPVVLLLVKNLPLFQYENKGKAES
jgi:Protein of unknown function with HXXEE motif